MSVGSKSKSSFLNYDNTKLRLVQDYKVQGSSYYEFGKEVHNTLGFTVPSDLGELLQTFLVTQSGEITDNEFFDLVVKQNTVNGQNLDLPAEFQIPS